MQMSFVDPEGQQKISSRLSRLQKLLVSSAHRPGTCRALRRQRRLLRLLLLYTDAGLPIIVAAGGCLSLLLHTRGGHHGRGGSAQRLRRVRGGPGACDTALRL